MTTFSYAIWLIFTLIAQALLLLAILIGCLTVYGAHIVGVTYKKTEKEMEHEQYIGGEEPIE